MGLRVVRVRARLRQGDIARVLGCSRSRIAQIEQAAEVSREWQVRYRAAVAEAARARKAPPAP